MPNKTRTELKTFFETGDKPTQAQFVDLIDSLINIIDDGLCPWQKVTKLYTDFQPCAVSEKFIDCFSMPAGYQLNRTIIIPTISFTGGGTDSAYISLYNEIDTIQYVNTLLNVFIAITSHSGVVGPGYVVATGPGVEPTQGEDVRIRLNIGGGMFNINNLTAGSVDIFYRLDKISQLMP